MITHPIRLAQNATNDPDLESLLHPAAAFERPRDVVNDADLTLAEKRAILSSWASDACAVESQPSLREPPGARAPVSFDEVADALRSLDAELQPRPHWKRRIQRSRFEGQDGPSPA
jgi:hypothetical protein